jgi:hypothetical protein
MGTKHTPGPWAVAVDIFDNDGMPETAIQAMNGGATVAVALDFGLNNPDMRQANARLIAAAPDLLVALNALVAAHGSILDLRESDELKLARAAIAQATGEHHEHG